MNITDIGVLLGKIQLGDNREITDLVIKEWHDTLWDHELEDCIEAVTMHRRESTDYLQPAHIVTLVKRIREARATEAEQRARIGAAREEWAPRPTNEDAMVAAVRSGDPDSVAREVMTYNEQLRAAGHPVLNVEWEVRKMLEAYSKPWDRGVVFR